MNQNTKDSDNRKEINYLPIGVENAQPLVLQPEDEIRRSDTKFLYISALIAQLLVLSSGSIVVWTSPVVSKLVSNNTDVNPMGRRITPEEVSLLGGLPILTGLIGSMLLAKLADVLGRKRLLQLISITIFFSGLLLALSQNITLSIAARCILLIFIQTGFANVPVYLAEITEDYNRAKFGCFVGLFHQIGHLYSYVIGPFFSIRTYTLILLIPSLTFGILSFLMPESPFYLLSKGREDEGLESLKKLRNNKTREELERDVVKISATLKKKTQRMSILRLYKTRENRIALFLGLLPCVIQQLCGTSTIMIYLAPFFDSAGTSLSGNMVAIIVGLVKISIFTITSFVVERVGRKRMLLISAVGTGVPFFLLGLFFYLKDVNSPIISQLQWLPLPCVLLMVSIYSLGLGPIPTAVMMDMVPPDYRAFASTLVLSVMVFVSFCLSSLYPIISTYLGVYWCVWSFSASCFLGAVLIYFFLPETKGKSLKEIQEMLKEY